MLRSPANAATAALILVLAVPDAAFVSAQAMDAPALRPPARQLKTDRRHLDGAAAPVSNVAAPSNAAAPKTAAPKAAALTIAPKATAPALAVKAAAPTAAAPKAAAASNATSKPKRVKVDKPKRTRGEGRHGMPTWLVVTMCLLGLAVPIGLVVLLMLYKRRQEAAGAGGSSAPHSVSTKEPWAQDDDDAGSGPDSPRPDPYASAFAGADDDEENAKL